MLLHAASHSRRQMTLTEFLHIRRTEPFRKMLVLTDFSQAHTEVAVLEQWYLPNEREFPILNMPHIVQRSQSGREKFKRARRGSASSPAQGGRDVSESEPDSPSKFYSQQLLFCPGDSTSPREVSKARSDPFCVSPVIDLHALEESCGVTGDKRSSVALVVPFSQLERVHELFGGVKLRHFESSRTWWTSEVRRGCCLLTNV